MIDRRLLDRPESAQTAAERPIPPNTHTHRKCQETVESSPALTHSFALCAASDL